MKTLFTFIILVNFSLNLFCQTHWTKHPDNPIMVPRDDKWTYNSISPFTVMLIDSTYHMYYQGSTNSQDWSFGHATSLDGITWTKDSNNPILELGAPGEWDSYWISDPSVLKFDTLFHMWYTGCSAGCNESSQFRIGHATSSDGIEWMKDPNNPVKDIDEGVPAANYCVHNQVLYDDSLYHIYYSQGNWSSNRTEIWHAISQDGYSWINDPLNPVMEDNTQIYPASVVFDGDQYIMWYGKGAFWRWEYYLAFSSDGSIWEKHGNNPVLSKGPPGSWDGLCFTSAFVLFDSTESKYKMWYGGAKIQGAERIGYAETYEPAWKQMRSMDIAKGGLQSCVIESMIYVFGGCNSSMVNIDSADAYNTKTNMWSNLKPMMKKLYESNAEVVNNKIYIIGGWQSDWNTSNSTMEYDPDGNNWVYRKDCPITTGGNTSCALNDTIYILGGLEYRSSQDQKKSLFYVPKTDSWASIPDMINNHGAYASSCVNNNKIYIFGGIHIIDDDNMIIHGKNEMYDPIKKTWNELAEMPVPVLNHISIEYNNKFYIFGGDSGTYSHERSYPTNVIQEYDPATDTWKLMNLMPFKRANMTGQRVNDFVYLFGGYKDDSRDLTKPLSEVWRFNLDSLKSFITDNTRIKEINKEYLSIFPNPASGSITIETGISDLYNIKIFSLNGQLIFRKEMKGSNYQLDLSSFQKGVYFITVRSKDFVITRKILKL